MLLVVISGEKQINEYLNTSEIWYGFENRFENCFET